LASESGYFSFGYSASFGEDACYEQLRRFRTDPLETRTTANPAVKLLKELERHHLISLVLPAQFFWNPLPSETLRTLQN
jgi:hypothetical protein